MRIPLHSFVDLITNSSSEIFVCANDSTVTAAIKLVDSILIAGGSKFRANDLFDITVSGDGPSRMLIVNTKVKSEAAKVAAGILADLTSTFRIEERYNG